MKWMEDEAWHRSIITKAVHPWIHIRVSTLLDIRFLDICFDNFLDNFLIIFQMKQGINRLHITKKLFISWIGVDTLVEITPKIRTCCYD